MKLRLFEAFAGVGSQRMALRNIGADFESVGIMEIDRYALLSYCSIHEGFDYDGEIPSNDEILKYISDLSLCRRLHIVSKDGAEETEIPENHEDLVKLYVASVKSKNYGDICRVEVDKLPDMDFFTYSFPCKDFSVAGLGKGAEKGSGTHSALVWECERVIRAKRPKYLMMENVPGMVTEKNIHILHQWQGILQGMGYRNFARVLNGYDYGVPQTRRRLIMFSVLGDSDFEFDLGDTFNHKKLRDIMIEGKADDSYYINQDRWPCERVAEVKPRMGLFGQTFGSEDGTIVAGYYPTKFESDRPIYSPNGACPTITASPARGTLKKYMKLWDDYGPRIFDPIECWRAQGYKDEDFYKAKEVGLDLLHLSERAGRGIVVPMLEAQYKRLFKEYICTNCEN